MVNWEDPWRPFVFRDTWQHVIIYGFFMLSGDRTSSIISQLCLARQSRTLDRAAGALAFYALLLLMAAHIQKGALQTQERILFMVPTFLLALVLNTEVWIPGQPRPWVLETQTGLVPSNCLLQVSMLTYLPPSRCPWQAGSPMDLAFITILFCSGTWAWGAVLLAAIYSLCSLWHHRCSSWTEDLGPMESSSEELEKPTAEPRRRMKVPGYRTLCSAFWKENCRGASCVPCA